MGWFSKKKDPVVDLTGNYVAPSVDQAVDMVGVPLKVGDLVSWHIGGRHGSGHVFGVVKAIIGKGQWVHDWEITKNTPEECISAAVNYRPRFSVEVTPLKKGRKGVTRSSDNLLHYITPEIYKKLTEV